ncbi:hypothetical protein I4F81_001428 [Pyropia yezoensis]|uniref:Uncharacterized protein n=1 Tax=Pyropia yezoensis TaxID=2788 RepID=A0ACC3BMM7_PYRYE|nr:hypothetical protein I4F81_001428 [Neopyropia yezoensis]
MARPGAQPPGRLRGGRGRTSRARGQGVTRGRVMGGPQLPLLCFSVVFFCLAAAVGRGRGRGGNGGHHPLWVASFSLVFVRQSRHEHLHFSSPPPFSPPPPTVASSLVPRACSIPAAPIPLRRSRPRIDQAPLEGPSPAGCASPPSSQGWRARPQ